MTVGSPLEMYITHFGWIAFNLIIGLMMSTYIILTPLITGVASAWLEGVRNTDTRPGVLSSMRRIELRVLSFALVFAFCVVPAVDLKLEELKTSTGPAGGLHAATEGTVYGPDEDPSSAKEPMMESISSLKSNFEGDPKVPWFWMVVMQVSSGFTHAFIGVLPDVFDIKAAQQDIGQFAFHEQGLASELDAFRDDCFKVARSKFDAWTTDGRFYDPRIVPTATQEKLEQNPDMVNWIGSPIFLETPGLYAACTDVDLCGRSPQAAQDIGGWPYMPLRDGPREAAYAASGSGRPYCKEWWDHGTRGLRGRVLRSAKPGGDADNVDLGRYVGVLWNLLGSRGDLALAQDIAIQRTIEKNLTTAAVFTNPIIGANDSAGRGTNHGVAAETLGALGSVWGGFKANITTKVLKSALYMLQGLALFMIYALLPFVMLFTGMAVRTVLMGGLMIFGIKFLTGIWAFSYFIDKTLHQVLYPDWGDASLSSLLSRPVHVAESESIYNMVSAGTYIFFPMMWFFVLGFAGVELSRSMNIGMSSGSNAAQQSTSAGIGMAGKATGGR